MKIAYTIGLVLIVIGGLNWGLVGLFDYNLVDMLLGKGAALTKGVYVLIGVAAAYVAIMATMPTRMHDKEE